MKYVLNWPFDLFKNLGRPWNMIVPALVLVLSLTLLSFALAGMLMFLPLHLTYWLMVLAVFALLSLAGFLYNLSFIVYALWKQGTLFEHLKPFGLAILAAIPTLYTIYLLTGDIPSPFPRTSAAFAYLTESLIILALLLWIVAMRSYTRFINRQIERRMRRENYFKVTDLAQLHIGQWISYHAPLRGSPLRSGFVTTLDPETETLRVSRLNPDIEGYLEKLDSIHICQITLADAESDARIRAYATTWNYVLEKAKEKSCLVGPLIEKEREYFEVLVTGATINPIVLELAPQSDGHYEIAQTHWAKDTERWAGDAEKYQNFYDRWQQEREREQHDDE